MRQKGFASMVLLLGIIVLVGVGYLGYQSFPKLQDKYSATLSPIPTIDPITEADNKRKVDILEIRNALEQYAVEHKGDYPQRLSLLDSYLALIPKDPITKEEYTYKLEQSNFYTVSATLSDGSDFTLTSPNMNFKSIENGDEIRKRDLRIIRSALELYASYTSNMSYPKSLSELTSKHIVALPKDPVSGLEYSYKRTSLNTYILSAILNDGTIYTETNP